MRKSILGQRLAVAACVVLACGPVAANDAKPCSSSLRPVGPLDASFDESRWRTSPASDPTAELARFVAQCSPHTLQQILSKSAHFVQQDLGPPR